MDINISTIQPTSSTPNDVETVGTNMISLTPGRLATNAPIGGGSSADLSELGKPKKKRKAKTKKVGNDEVVVAEEDLPMAQSNIPYHNTYGETDAILKRSIAQLDSITADIHEDIEEIRSSKTIRKKYDYMSEMTSTMVSSIQAKIQAARELNNTIKNAHELDLKRMKEMKLNEREQDDAKSIMDMYQAFISTPVSQNLTGPFTSPLGANTIDLTLASSNPNTQIAMMGQNPDIAYNQFVNNMSPEQMMMMIEEDPNMKHVIAYDPNTGNAEFAVYNQSTGQFVQGVPTRNKDMYMDGMNFNFGTMQAHSNDLNETYDIIYTAGAAPAASPTDEVITADNSEVNTTTSDGKDMSNY